MTVVVTNPIVNPTVPDRSASAYSGTVPVTYGRPTQIMGLVPLTDCSLAECRVWNVDCCFIVPVFAQSGTSGSVNVDTTKNDQSMFMISMPSYNTGSTQTAIATFMLQKYVGNTWVTQTPMISNALGTFYNFYSLPIYYYKGYNVEWRKVLDAYGEGCYRIYVNYNVKGIEGCLTSEPFSLQTWDCEKMHGTIRCDAYYFDGSVASIDIDGWRYSLCGIKLRDSIRFPGFFGYEESEEDQKQIELTDGVIYKTRDELIQKFQLITSPLPKWFHDRFKMYGTTADDLRVTDYNWNNSDYLIKNKKIVRDGGVKPDYRIGSRLAIAKYNFKEGYQNVSRSLCCDDSTFTGR